MDGIWLEDGSFQVAPGQKGKFKDKGKSKGKGKKGKGKGKADDEPDAKKPRTDGGPEEEVEGDSFDFEGDWKDKQVCLVNLKTASLNGAMGVVKEYLGAEDILVDGKKKTIRRFQVQLDASLGAKSIKLENLYKVMTGSLVKLRGLDMIELNDSVAECGKLDVATMRYDVVLSDGRHIKCKPANVDFLARYEGEKVAGAPEQMERFRSANGLRDRLAVVEECQYPVPQLLPAAALEAYAKKFPKSVVIGRSNAANPKGTQALAREVTSSLRVSPGSRLVFVSVPRDRCIAPKLEDLRHDELLRLGEFSGWVAKRCDPQPVYFLLPGVAAKGPPSLLNAASCAWPLYVAVCTDILLLESERWQKSAWARTDALLAAWARRPLYILPEKYKPPVELGNVGAAPATEPSEDAQKATEPLTFRQEEPFTISRPTEGSTAPPAMLVGLAERAAEIEGTGTAKVHRPTLAVKRLG